MPPDHLEPLGAARGLDHGGEARERLAHEQPQGLLVVHHQDRALHEARFGPRGPGLEPPGLRGAPPPADEPGTMEGDLPPGVLGWLVAAASLAAALLAALSLARRARRAEERYRAVLRLAPDSVAVLDGQGRILDLNPAAERTFGVRREHILGHASAEFVPAALREQLAQAAELGAAGEVPWQEAFALRGDGERFPVEAALTRVRESSPPLFVGYLRDVSQQRRQEALTDEIVATVSHEMRTPLTSVLGFAELLLERDVEPARARRMLEVIAAESGRLARLIDDLLELKRMQAGADALRLSRVELGELIRAVVARIPPGRSDVAVSVEAPPLPWLDVDAGRLEQVLINLVSNAVKFSPPGGRVVLRMTSEAGERIVLVDDEGPGIPEADLARVFEPFYRSPGSQAQRVPGTGLGLSLVKQIVKEHGGRVLAERAPAGGARVGFALPEASAAPREKPDPGERADEAALRDGAAAS